MQSLAPDDGAHPLVTLVLPAKDEAEAIGTVLARLPTKTLDLMGVGTETVLLDGDSQDGTRAIAYEHGGTTVVFDEGEGKARALRDARPRFNGDYVVMLDADGTYAVDAIPRVLAPLLRDDADVVMGRRCIQPGAMSPSHRLGNRLLSWMARLLYQHPCPDLCTGMWGFQRDAIDALPLEGTGFELEAELFAHAARLDLRIGHVPIDYLPRLGSSKLGTSDGLRIGWWLIRSRWADLDDRRTIRGLSPPSTPDRPEHPPCVHEPLDPTSTR